MSGIIYIPPGGGGGLNSLTTNPPLSDNGSLTDPVFDLDFQNGLQLVGSNLQWGGALTANTIINGGGSRSLSFSSLTDFTVDAANSGGFNLQNTQTGLGVSQIIMPSFPTAGVIITHDDSVAGGGVQQLLFGGWSGLGGSGVVLTDASNNRGIVNAADYSANFVLESLVTRRWVEAQGYTSGDGIYAGSGPLTANTTVTMGLNDLVFSSTGSSNNLVIDSSGGAVGVGVSPSTGSTLEVFQPENATDAAIYIDLDQPASSGARKALSIVNTDASVGFEQFSIEKDNTSGFVFAAWRDISGNKLVNIAGVSTQTWFNQFVTIGTNSGQNQNKLRIVGFTSGTHLSTRNSSGDEELNALDNGAVRINVGQQVNGDFRVYGFTDNALIFTDASANEVGIGTTTPSSKLDVVGDVEIGDTNSFYWGDPATNDSWRVQRSGDDLVFQQREGGSWVTKSTISGA